MQHSQDTPNSKYTATQMRNINIIFMGKTTCGKSTLLKVVERGEYYLPPAEKLMSDTKEAEMRTISLCKNGGEAVALNIIDTPGLFETRLTEAEVRKNEVLLEIAEQCLMREITKIHVLCIFVNIKAGFLRDDIETIRELMTFFGKVQVKKNCMLVATHAESKSATAREEILSEFNAREDLRDIRDFFGLGVFFVGALDRDTIDNFGAEVRPAMANKVAALKDVFLDEVLKQREPIALPEISRVKERKEAMRQEIKQQARREMESTRCNVM